MRALAQTMNGAMKTNFMIEAAKFGFLAGRPRHSSDDCLLGDRLSPLQETAEGAQLATHLRGVVRNLLLNVRLRRDVVYSESSWHGKRATDYN